MPRAVMTPSWQRHPTSLSGTAGLYEDGSPSPPSRGCFRSPATLDGSASRVARTAERTSACHAYERLSTSIECAPIWYDEATREAARSGTSALIARATVLPRMIGAVA